MRNYTKHLLSGAILFTFLIAACGSTDDTFNFMLIYLLIAIIIAIILSIIIVNFNKKSTSTSHNPERRKQAEKYFKEQERQEHEKECKSFLDMYGNPTKEIWWNNSSFLFVYEENHVIVMNKKVYKFADIINYTISDNATTIYSSTLSQTKTDANSMLGRAIIGGVLTGGVGAIIGGTTAKKETITKGGTSRIKHNYEIIVTMNSLSDPTIRLKIGDNSFDTNQIASLLSIILTRNTQNIKI